ncbi:MFS general substrate transporter [Glarea lozoyensis ATCC 20868]|uniref:Nitrate/nitrite transporter n=1 Tax=Glarea lozoyensis (strain ATCC 20868 / MF5171) TaxID=1116229 RepID=S3CRP8_GLAL2|nr:MFS general substrate transporter [Glarea lozoyensis ATCC 20868]EPE29142.1 MFS general substrate transporter [Glarea lozoyensis ATCC 20868]
MAFGVSSLWLAPEVNPVNFKARTIPMLNPINKYGRVYFFSWFGFMIAFLAWYSFPPLLSDAIKHDLKLTQNEIANSNIIALTATLLVRLVAGPACDAFGPRKTFAACLLIGAIPSVLAGTIHNAMGLYFIRFFVGILGGSFVPCQVWSTGFFDKNIVGTANSFTAGLGNAGGGITYFVMPAVYDSLRRQQHLTEHVAWRVSYVVPFIMITAVAIALFLLCEDTPTGKWSDRHLAIQQNLQSHGVRAEGLVDVPGSITDKHPTGESPNPSTEKQLDEEADLAKAKHGSFDHEANMGEQEMLDAARGEVVQKPTFKEAMSVIFTPQTLVVAGCYFCSFGAELAINSILGAYYLKQFPKLGQTGTGNWAAMFGLLNVVFRPLGGIASDYLYRRTRTVWSKKILLHALAIMTGVFQIIIGITNSHNQSTMFGLIAGMAFFLEAGNGANFSLVPHIHPFANGIISGVTGACGNLGGIVFAVIFRYNMKDYGKSVWIIGVMTIAINLAICWIKPIPKGQIGGR